MNVSFVVSRTPLTPHIWNQCDILSVNVITNLLDNFQILWLAHFLFLIMVTILDLCSLLMYCGMCVIFLLEK